MRTDFRYWEGIEVRWSDMDAIGHVNNAVYFTYCEEARIRYFKALNLLGFREHDKQGPALVSATCNFRQQVRYPAELEIGVCTSKFGSRSFTIDLEIYYKGTENLVADGTCVIAWVDYKVGRSIRVPEQLKLAVCKFEGKSL